MKMTHILPFALALLCGCSTMTPWSRDAAAKLERKVGAYSERQHDRVKRVNAEYRRNFAKLTSELTRLHDEKLDFDLRSDADEIADSVLNSWEEQTLPSHLQLMFATRRAEQFGRYERAEEAIGQARSDYAKSHRELRLQFNRLNKSRENLRALSSDRKTNELLIRLAQGVNDLVNNIETNRKPSAVASD